MRRRFQTGIGRWGADRPPSIWDVDAIEHRHVPDIADQEPRGQQVRRRGNREIGAVDTAMGGKALPSERPGLIRGGLVDRGETGVPKSGRVAWPELPVVRAAVPHAQFETIHPFIDGNGRTGRALIHTVLRRGDALRNTLIPVSTVFAGDTDAYLAGLTAFRADPPQLDEWVTAFAHAAELAAANAVQLSEQIAHLDEVIVDDLIQYRHDHGLVPARPRSDAVILRILASLANEPVLTVEGTAARHQVSTAAAHRALVELADAGILGRSKDGRGRLICWTADQHLALVALTERSNRAGGVAPPTTGRFADPKPRPPTNRTPGKRRRTTGAPEHLATRPLREPPSEWAWRSLVTNAIAGVWSLDQVGLVN